MDRIHKFIRKLSADEARRALEAITLVREGRLNTLDVRKLKGRENEYRVRIGSIRIQFVKKETYNHITDIEFRGDHTY
ncbi:hypothetical protein HY968_02740 [Candidatus Kaiserbacteria bacterium]|nr:hypothetical protein [Candidatus Kaiserbacteria bacterium]